ncbi:hypothetical protein HPB51_025218 [Rhipicephalus microplus]|uniref:THAP-type domain-containing protein n=1 Tax=Rhipicephalus microplus TaxID=6941 RepID=A0A9J6DRC2_RHIMP|nr:hypothetical protein HPB51_025218 [Rhipicephalus microplus]
MSSGVKRKASQTHCFAPGCSSGYVSARKSGRQVSLFSVPKDPERFKAWHRAVPRADKPLEATSLLCELHFDEQYLVRFFTHTINGETVRIPRDRPKLTDNAIPTVYLNVPAYLSKKPPQKRTSRTSTGGLPAKIPRCEGSAYVHDNAANSHEDGSFSNSPTALDIASCEPPSAYWVKHRIARADSATAFTVCAMNNGNLALEKVVLFTANECSVQAKVSVQAPVVKNVQVSSTAMAQELLAEANSLIPCKGFGEKGEFAANPKRQENTCGGKTFSMSCPGVAQELGKACPKCRYLRKLLLNQASYKRRKAHACTRPDS